VALKWHNLFPKVAKNTAQAMATLGAGFIIKEFYPEMLPEA